MNSMGEPERTETTRNGRDGIHTGQKHYRTMENNKE